MSPSFREVSSALLLFVLVGCGCLCFFSGCETYRIVKLGAGVSEGSRVSPFYAVARNNVVIPEYVVDQYGNYPTTVAEAEERFARQKSLAETLVREKYDLASSSSAQIPQYILGIGLSLVSPIVLPIQWLGEVFSGQSGPHRSFSQVAADYFRVSFNSPIHEKPRIRERVDYFY